MIKKIATAVLFVMFSSLALSQSAPELNPPLIPGQLQVVCSSLAQLESMLKEYSEIPLTRGLVTRENTTSSLVIFVNPETQSFTVVEKTPNGLYCVLALGQKLEAVPKDDRKELQNKYDPKKL